MNFKGIPEEMKQYKNWVLWKLEKREGQEKPTKIPYNAKGYKASSNKAETWNTYEEVKKAYETGEYNGVGFMFGDSPYCGIDIDNCISETGIKPKAYEIIKQLDSWTELSQSEKGIHIIVEAPKPEGRNRNDKWDDSNGVMSGLEIYDTGRYFALTGKRIEGTPATIESRQEQLKNICDNNFKKEVKQPEKQPQERIETTLNEREIIEKAERAQNGNKFRALYNGDMSEYANDQSRADQALCNLIAFYTKDFNTIDSIFKSSGLYRAKWDRNDYKTKTINNALSTVTETYNEGYNITVQQKKEKPKQEEQPEQTKEEYLKNNTANHLQAFMNGITESVNTPSIPTGFNDLDIKLDGGLYEGLYILGAISSLGKSTFILQIADQIAQQGQDVLFFSLEMARSELMAKSISRNTFILCDNHKDAKTTRGITAGKKHLAYSPKENELIKKSIQAYSEYAGKIYISEGLGTIGVEQIKETVKKHIEFTGNKPVIFIDYLQILAPYDMRATDKQNTDKAVMELKRISRDYKIPVIGISSFNRENYSNSVSMVSFKESGAIEYSSDVLMGLQFKRQGELDEINRVKSKNEPKIIINVDEEKRKDPREVELKILKNRNGATGNSMFYNYYPLFNFFEEMEAGKEVFNISY